MDQSVSNTKDALFTNTSVEPHKHFRILHKTRALPENHKIDHLLAGLIKRIKNAWVV